MADHVRNTVDADKFNADAVLPYSLRLMDFQIAMQDVYDLFHDINSLLLARSLKRLEEMLRPAAMSGLISDLLTASLAIRDGSAANSASPWCCTRGGRISGSTSMSTASSPTAP